MLKEILENLEKGIKMDESPISVPGNADFSSISVFNFGTTKG